MVSAIGGVMVGSLSVSKEATAAELAVQLLQDLSDIPVTTLRRISGNTSVQSAVALARSLLQLDVPETSAWLRCLLSELFFAMGCPADSRRVLEELSQTAVPKSVADSATVADVLTLSLIDPAAAATRSKVVLRRTGDRSVVDCAAVASAAVLAETCWSRGRLQEALRWARWAAVHVEAVPSPFWRMYVRLDAASKLADVGAFGEAAALTGKVRTDYSSSNYPGINAALHFIRAKTLIHQGQWYELGGDASGSTYDAGERLYAPLLLAQLSIAASYSNDTRTAVWRLEECERILQPPSDIRCRPLHLWSRLLLEEAKAGPQAALKLIENVHSGESGPLLGLFCAVPGAAAWVARTALRCGNEDLLTSAATTMELLEAINPELADVAMAARHVRGLVKGDSAELVQAVAQQSHAWARACAANDLVSCLDTRPQTPALHHISEPLSEPWDELTAREQQVARLAADGLTNRQISSQLGCSAHTVNFHLRNVFRKLNILSRVEIGKYLPPLSASADLLEFRPASRHRSKPA